VIEVIGDGVRRWDVKHSDEPTTATPEGSKIKLIILADNRNYR